MTAEIEGVHGEFSRVAPDLVASSPWIAKAMTAALLPQEVPLLAGNFSRGHFMLTSTRLVTWTQRAYNHGVEKTELQLRTLNAVTVEHRELQSTITLNIEGQHRTLEGLPPKAVEVIADFIVQAGGSAPQSRDLRTSPEVDEFVNEEVSEAPIGAATSRKRYSVDELLEMMDRGELDFFGSSTPGPQALFTALEDELRPGEAVERMILVFFKRRGPRPTDPLGLLVATSARLLSAGVMHGELTQSLREAGWSAAPQYPGYLKIVAERSFEELDTPWIYRKKFFTLDEILIGEGDTQPLYASAFQRSKGQAFVEHVNERRPKQSSTSTHDTIFDDALGPAAGPQTVVDIHTLGPEGSGKTVFLASMYHRMRLRRPGTSFSITTKIDAAGRLNEVYNSLVDPDSDWPQSTREIREWTFDTLVQAPSGDFSPLRFRYLDYPGGVLSRPSAAQDSTIQELVSKLRSAGALLVLLDGAAMVSLVRGEQAGRRYMSFDLSTSLDIAQQSRCPVHFVVTKWDLLADHYTLTDVRRALLLDENFRDLVAAKIEDSASTVRLIPVSSVGLGYAAMNADGEMVKTGNPPRPLNVEMPLLSVLPDFLMQAHQQIVHAAAEVDAKEAGRSRVAGVAAATLRAIVVRRYPVLGLVPNAVFEKAVGYGDRLLRRRAEAADANALTAARRDVTSDSAAMSLVEQQCEMLVSQFEQREAASVLGGGLTAYTRPREHQ